MPKYMTCTAKTEKYVRMYVPIRYDLHLNMFHTYGTSPESRTFINKLCDLMFGRLDFPIYSSGLYY